MNRELESVFEKYDERLVSFVRELVKIKSYSDQEEALARRIKAEMEELGFDEASIDSTGNVIGRIGPDKAGKGGKVGKNGEKSILFDSHMDTVEVNDAEEWAHPPFAAEIADGRLYGRGSVDMKSALAASVYAAAIAKELGWTAGKTVYVTCTVCEEYCDGENLKMLFEERSLKPDYVVICEPSDNIITLGHKGKAQMEIKTHGVSAHGSAPEKGVNAVYEMAEIIKRVETLNERLSSTSSSLPHGTIVLSDISCVSASLNAVPSECRIYLDRRMILGETEADIEKEMDSLVNGKRASWEIGTLKHKSWAGRELVYNPMHTAWRIADDHELTRTLNSAYEDVYGHAPENYDFWDFGTNAVTPVSMGIPTIGFGPGEYKLAHMRNENCEVSKIKEACRFYASVIDNI